MKKIQKEAGHRTIQYGVYWYGILIIRIKIYDKILSLITNPGVKTHVGNPIANLLLQAHNYFKN